MERLKCEKVWWKLSFSPAFIFCHTEAGGMLCSADYRERTTGNFWEFSVIKPLWLEFHKMVKCNYNINLLLQFATLFPGNVDLQARGTDEYLFGLLISACKNLPLGAGYFLDPPWYILDCYCK